MAWLTPISTYQAATVAPLGASDNLFVAGGVLISSSGSYTVRGTGANHLLIYGTVTGTFSDTPIYLGTNPSTISGAVVDIFAGGHVQALGQIATAIVSWGLDWEVHNSGLIDSFFYGIYTYDTGTATDSLISNAGTIHGKEAIVRGIGSTETLIFQNSGLLSGNSHAYTATLQGDTTARDLITNTGRIVGVVDLGGGNDSYIGASGHLSGKLFAGGGNDAITGGSDNDRFEGGVGNDALTGNGGNDTLLGQDGNDTLNGGLGNDIMNGGIGNDRLYGGLGNDTLAGAAGADVFVFNTALNASTNRDTVADFSHVDDTFWLENAVFTKLGAGVHALSPAFFHAGATAADANDYIVYNQATGVLSYDTNGNAAGGAIAFAFLANHPALAANDFLVI